MSSDQHERVAELFLAVCEKPAEERASFLDEACAGDAELRAEIESLLANDAPSTLPLETPPSGAHRKIGRFETRGLIGIGGMGTVYEAVQDHPHRLVALKVLSRGAASPSAMKRFRHEAEVLGRLRHPNIAQIHDAGTFDEGEGAQPYFAMELVKGEPLVEYADKNDLGTRDRLRLFVKVCHAVQYAHHKGVIHRDLKPDNVLVDDFSEPKILDFGIARATGSDIQVTTLRTDIGQLIGTVPYMSPEQVTGDPAELDTRSDVYSLGVVLYELLCGRLPHDLSEKSIPEAARVIREDDPTPLSSINRIYRGDLETIVAKALEKDKTRRYQTAAELAADINHYLADEPIVARPPSTFYQLRKFARRNRTLVVGVTGMFVLLVAGFIGTTWGLIQARVETAKSQATNEYLMTLLALTNPAEGADELADFGGASVQTVSDLVDEASRSLETAFPDWPLVRADMHLRLAKTYWGLGRNDELHHHAKAALDLYRSELGDDHPTTLDSRFWYHRSQRWIDAEPVWPETVNGFERVLGPDDRRTLRARLWYVTAVWQVGKLREAEERFQELIETTTEVLGPEDKITLTARNQYASQLNHMARHADAERLAGDALKVARESLPPGDLVTAKLAMTLGHSLRHQDRFEEARAAYQEAYALYHYERAGIVWQALSVIRNLADTLAALDRAAEAEPIIRAKIEDCRRELGEDHDRTMWIRFELGRNLQAQNRLEEAEALLQETVDYYAPLKGEDQYYVVFAKQQLGYVLRAQGRLAEAEVHFREVYEACNARNKDDNDALHARRDFAGILFKQEKFEDALVIYREQMEVQRRVYGPGTAAPLWAKMNMARALKRMGPEHYAEAESLVREAYEGIAGELGEDNPFTLDAQWQLGEVLYRRRDAEWVGILLECLERRRQTSGPDHPDTQFVLRGLRDRLEKRERFEELERLNEAWPEVLASD